MQYGINTQETLEPNEHVPTPFTVAFDPFCVVMSPPTLGVGLCLSWSDAVGAIASECQFKLEMPCLW